MWGNEIFIGAVGALLVACPGSGPQVVSPDGNSVTGVDSLVPAHESVAERLELTLTGAGTSHCPAIGLLFQEPGASAETMSLAFPLVRVGISPLGPGEYAVQSIEGGTCGSSALEGGGHYAARGGDGGVSFFGGSGILRVEEGGRPDSCARTRGIVDLVFNIDGREKRLLARFDTSEAASWWEE